MTTDRSGLTGGIVSAIILPPLGVLWGLVTMMRGYGKEGLIIWLWAIVIAPIIWFLGLFIGGLLGGLVS